MITDAELFTHLPSQRHHHLAAAIGRRLIEIERFLTRDPSSFLADGRFSATDFFSHNSGPVQLYFEGDLTHVLDIWGEQLSVVVMDTILSANAFGSLYRLTAFEPAPPAVLACIGKRCHDVRIWTLAEDFESEEAKEVAISYALSESAELFYCIYLHEDLDSDYLLPGQDVPREKVATCFSLARGEYVNPGK